MQHRIAYYAIYSRRDRLPRDRHALSEFVKNDNFCSSTALRREKHVAQPPTGVSAARSDD